MIEHAFSRKNVNSLAGIEAEAHVLDHLRFGDVRGRFLRRFSAEPHASRTCVAFLQKRQSLCCDLLA